MNDELMLENQETVPGADSGIWTSIANIFISPARAFRSIVKTPRWLMPFIVVVIMSVVFEASIGGLRMADLRRDVQSDPDYSAEEIQIRVANIDAQKHELLSSRTLLGVILLTGLGLVKLLGLTLVVWISLFLFASNLGFKHALSLCAFSGLVTVPEVILKIPLMLLKGTTHIWVSPAILLPAAMKKSVLFNILEKFDLFVIWQIILIALGLSIIAHISQKKANILVGCLFALWILVGVSFGDLIRIT